MKTKHQSFAEILRLFEYKLDVRTAFEDFLTMSICSFGQNPATGKSYDEDLYLETIARYKDDHLRLEFPKLLAALVNEMTERMDSGEGWDVLGEFYEVHMQRKGLSQFFTPWPVCTFMAQCAYDESRSNTDNSRPLRILDPSCGSGRMLMAASRVAGSQQEYYGIDVDLTCVKMTTLNLFLSGLFHTETICADALLHKDFRVSYRSSFLPFGLFRIQEKEQSKLWYLMQTSRTSEKIESKKEPLVFTDKPYGEGSQLTIF